MSDTTDSKSTIIPFPDFEALKKDVEKLYTELSMLFLERDTLIFIECRSIKMLYMLEVGGLEYKSYELECQIRRQKRKVELIQAKKNRQEIVILSQIDKTLDTEFVEYNDEIDEKVKDMTASLNLRRVGKILPKEEVTELKTLYRSIAKSLHPDLHPEVSDAQIKLFNLAICAYQRGDLASLQTIEAMVGDKTIPTDSPDAMVSLVKEKKRLIKLLQTVNDDITAIKNEFPYTMKEFINSPDQIEAKKKELQEKNDNLTDVLEGLNKKIAEMLR